jgi:hypothetical protein
MASFDWYQGTIQRPIDDVLEVLSGLAPRLSLSHGRGLHGYATTSRLGNLDEGTVAAVWHGGTHAYPHAVISGQWAQPGAELIRLHFPLHTVSRIDVREDFEDEGAFDAIQAKLLVVAHEHRVKVDTKGDHLLTKRGRTTYLGSTKSAVMMRLYDKRAEVMAKLPPFGPERHIAAARLGYDVPDHWTRLEAQIRPATPAAKAELARTEPIDALGSAPWMREVWRSVCGLELSPIQVGRGYRLADDERAYRYMCLQYGSVLKRMQADLGSWECVGLQIGSDLSGQGPGGTPK